MTPKLLGSSLLALDTVDDERGGEEGEEKEKEGMGRVGFEPTTPAMSRRYPNQARPPAQYTMKKFVAQIYVVDCITLELTNSFCLNFIKPTL